MPERFPYDNAGDSLSEEQEQYIISLVEKHPWKILSLQHELTDHLCCAVESSMREGVPFHIALQAALGELAPSGLAAVEEETIDIMNKTEIAMPVKKIVFLTGLMSAMAMSVGWLMRILRWPMGVEVLTAGLLGLVFLFLPLLSFYYFRNSNINGTVRKAQMLAGISSAVLLGLAIVFKLLHLQGADVVLLAGGVLFTFVFLPLLFFSIYRNSLETQK